VIEEFGTETVVTASESLNQLDYKKAASIYSGAQGTFNQHTHDFLFWAAVISRLMWVNRSSDMTLHV